MAKANQFSEREQEILDELRMHREDAVRLPDGNLTMPSMFKRFLALTDDHRIQWYNEDDPESHFEAYFRVKENATFEDGLMIAEFWGSLFDAFELQSMGDEDGDGRQWFRLLFDSADELDTGDRVKTYDGRVGTVNEPSEREHQDEPRSLRVNVTFDDTGLGEWVERADVERA